MKQWGEKKKQDNEANNPVVGGNGGKSETYNLDGTKGWSVEMMMNS